MDSNKTHDATYIRDNNRGFGIWNVARTTLLLGICGWAFGARDIAVQHLKWSRAVQIHLIESRLSNVKQQDLHHCSTATASGKKSNLIV
jgi:hypothetical protein